MSIHLIYSALVIFRLDGNTPYDIEFSHIVSYFTLLYYLGGIALPTRNLPLSSTIQIEKETEFSCKSSRMILDAIYKYI